MTGRVERELHPPFSQWPVLTGGVSKVPAMTPPQRGSADVRAARSLNPHLPKMKRIHSLFSRGRMAATTSFIQLLGVALFVSSVDAQPSDTRQVVRQVSPSVVLVAVFDAAGQPLALGSGFVVTDSSVVTNRHVIAGGTRASVKVVGDSTTLQVTMLLAADSTHDLVLLEVRGLHARLLRIADSHSVEVGQRVLAIGNPRGLEGSVSEGIVSGIRSTGRDTLLQITAPISPGSSGGPVVNDRGELVGVAVGAIVDGQNLNFAVPSNYVARLLASRFVPRPLSTAARIRSPRSLPVVNGAAARDGVVLGSFLWSSDMGFQLGSNCFNDYCQYSFSIRNDLDRPIRNVKYLVVFYDRSGQPIDSGERRQEDLSPIRSRLAIRATGAVLTSVRRLTSRVEFRLLDFEIVP
jgi:S1-C subfamily serine protease